MSSGWVWEIPHWNSIGTGYNYSGEHIDKYDARLSMILKYLERKQLDDKKEEKSKSK